jgi:uncharacterized protein YjiS (DUF1127 family)
MNEIGKDVDSFGRVTVAGEYFPMSSTRAPSPKPHAHSWAPGWTTIVPNVASSTNDKAARAGMPARVRQTQCRPFGYDAQAGWAEYRDGRCRFKRSEFDFGKYRNRVSTKISSAATKHIRSPFAKLLHGKTLEPLDDSSSGCQTSAMADRLLYGNSPTDAVAGPLDGVIICVQKPFVILKTIELPQPRAAEKTACLTRPTAQEPGMKALCQ